VFNSFFDRLQPNWKVLEIGTKGWDGKPPIHHRSRVVSKGATWTGVDIEPGDGVDVVADAHELSKHFPPNHFDAALLCSTLEHLRRPWVAIEELSKVVRRGGIVFCSTHQSFPVHGYPSVYFRFTIEGLKEVFSGWNVTAQYEFPCKVIPLSNIFTHARDWNFTAEAWLNVVCIAEKP
jgi:SAM-dependent methyltransferase